MTLIRENAASLYQQIANVLRNEINSGRYEPSGKLPSEPALCKRFEVSRVTVRLALGVLSDEGSVERKQGKGTFANGKRVRHGLDQLRSFHDSLVLQGLKPTMRLLSREVVAIPERLSAPFGESGENCLFLQRLHLVDDEPVALGRSYFPLELKDVSWDITESQPTYAILQGLTGLQVATADLAIKVAQCDHELAKALGLKTGAALLVMERTSYFSNGACCDHSTFYIRPERYEFVMKTSFSSN